MKRFIVSVLCATVFSIGLGALVDQASASFKSDEKALALIKQARLAIGGEQSIADVRSMIIKGTTSHTFKLEGVSRTEQGESEIAMQLPDKISKMVKIGRHDGGDGEKIINKQHDVIVMSKDGKVFDGEVSGPGERRVIVRKMGEAGDGEVEKVILDGKDGEFTTSDGKKIMLRKAEANGPIVEEVIVNGGGVGGEKKRIMIEADGAAAHGARRQNELLHTTLSLLLSAPEGMDVEYTYGGEVDVDGTTCNLVNANFAGSTVKLFLSKASSLPVMVSYQGHGAPRVMAFKSKAPEGAELKDKVVTFTHKIDAPEMAEVQVRFADYRSVNGVQLPHKWTTSMGGQVSEVLDVTSYEINPANIADKFQNQKTWVRTKKDVN